MGNNGRPSHSAPGALKRESTSAPVLLLKLVRLYQCAIIHDIDRRDGQTDHLERRQGTVTSLESAEHRLVVLSNVAPLAGTGEFDRGPLLDEVESTRRDENPDDVSAKMLNWYEYWETLCRA